MPSFVLNIPDGDVAQTLQERAKSLGFVGVKALTVSLLKDQYKIAKRLAAHDQAKTLEGQEPTDADIT